MRALVAFVAAMALAVLASAGQAAAPTLDARLGRALVAPGIAQARTAALAVDLQTGGTVYSTHADVPLLPASAEKLPVSFAALRLLGPSYRFRTEVVGDGQKVRAHLGRRSRPRGLRRPDAGGVRPERARARGRPLGDQARDRARRGGRELLRRTPRRAGLEAVVRRHRVPPALGAVRGGRALRGSERLGGRRCAHVHRRARAPRRLRAGAHRKPRLLRATRSPSPSTTPIHSSTSSGR